MFNIYKYIKYLIFHTREIYLNTQDSFLAIHFHLRKPRLGSCQIAFHSRIFLTFVEFHLYYCKTICYYDLFCLVILYHHGYGHMIVDFWVTMDVDIMIVDYWVTMDVDI
jgi:hypothetical protein